MTRRELAELVPAIVAFLSLEGGMPAQQQGGNRNPNPNQLTREQLKQALALQGLSFKDEYLDMMIPSVNQALESVKELRKVTIPADVDPCVRFSPMLSGMKRPGGVEKFAATRAGKARAWKNVEELAFWPAVELGHLIRTKKVTSTDLTKMYLGRMKKHMPTLLCTITLMEDQALEAAKQADAEIRRGKYRGPLHGLPYGAKDLLATKGVKTTWGAEPYKDQMIDYDATVVARLRDAGAILMAKLSMGALALGGLWFGGMTKTPWNVEQTSSGSSAGSASATAAGLVAFSIGTETLGSIVTPSTRCGVTGLRPTFGRVPRYGAMALSWTMDKIGPICRSVEDCMVVLRAIDGPDGKDLTAEFDAPLNWAPAAPLKGLKVGVLREDFARITQEPRKKVYDEALEALKKAGVAMEDTKLPAETLVARNLLGMLNAEAAAAFDDLTRSGGVEKLNGQGRNDWPNSFRSARLESAVEYVQAARARTMLMRQFHEYFQKYDVLVSPTGSLSLTVTNLTGHPQMVVPCGFPGNEPMGLLFTGHLYEEGKMARVAKAFQDGTEWNKKMPPGFGG